MAECVEGPVAAEEKQINSEAQEMDVQNAGEHTAAVSEVTTESEAVKLSEDKLETDAVPEKTDDVVPVAKAEETSHPNESNVPEALNDKDDAVSEMPIVPVATEVDLVPEESKEEAEECLQSSSKKRKSDDDKETSGEEVKKLKTEETPAAVEAVKSNDEAPVDNSTPTETAVMEIAANKTESSPAETAPMDVVANETEAIPAENIIPEVPEESANKSSKEEIIEPPVEKEEEANVVNDQQEDKDLSENKENVIEETISNGTTEKEAIKTVESGEEEAVKVSAVKALDETEQPKEAEAVSS